MNIVKNVVVAIAALVVVCVAIGLMLPKTAHVERSIAIEAPAAMVFTVLNGFGQFNRWSPWADIDPDATTTYEGPASGVGDGAGAAGLARRGRRGTDHEIIMRCP